jgi:hypothetical protein
MFQDTQQTLQILHPIPSHPLIVSIQSISIPTPPPPCLTRNIPLIGRLFEHVQLKVAPLPVETPPGLDDGGVSVVLLLVQRLRCGTKGQ